MRKLFMIGILSCVMSVCFAQQNSISALDSLGLISRAKADVVLAHFDSIHPYSKKILYALNDSRYYVIVQDKDNYSEYYVSTYILGGFHRIIQVNYDAIIQNLQAQKYLSKKKRRILQGLKNDRQIIRNAFDLTQYPADFMTTTPTPSTVGGQSSYFVLKDENNNRCAEYYLRVSPLPPVNSSLWYYLFRGVTIQPFHYETQFSLTKQAEKHHKYCARKCIQLYKKNGNVFFIKSTYCNKSVVWTYCDNTIEIYTLLDNKITQTQTFSTQPLSPPIERSAYAQIREEMAQKRLWIDDDDSLNFRIDVANGETYGGYYPIDISTLKQGNYQSEFLNRIVQDMITYKIQL